MSKVDQEPPRSIEEPSDAWSGEAGRIDAFVGARIRARRNVLGITQTKLAEQLGVTFQQVQKYEKGTNRVAASTLYRLGEILSVPIQYFFGDTKNEGSGTAFELLQNPQVVAVLRAFVQIEDKRVRQAVLDFVGTVAPSSRTVKGPVGD